MFYDGVLVLEKSWSGEVVYIGGSLYVGSLFGSLFDLVVLEV